MTRTTAFGAYEGSDRTALERAARLERWLGHPLAVQQVFTAWTDDAGARTLLFDDLLPAMWEAGRLPVVTWEPFTPTPEETPETVLEDVAAGEYDADVRRWADRLAAAMADADVAATPALALRFAHEQNGDWYPWSVGDAADARTYVAAWRRVRSLVDEHGPPPERLSWVWSVNHVSTSDVPLAESYPGDDVVDCVGVDGYNWGASRSWSTWQSPRAVFAPTFETVAAISDRPVCVPEVATTSLTADGHDVARKAAWIRDALAYLRSRGVAWASWFDVDKETDWAVFGGERGAKTVRVDGAEYAAYPAFGDAVRE